VPAILGFDPRYQFIHEDDLVEVLRLAVAEDLDGVYNAAADGVLALSEIASLLGKPLAPVLPPWGAGLAAAALRGLGVRVPAEVLQQLRYGRGLDNRKLKATGWRNAHTTREAVAGYAEALRVKPLLAGDPRGYRYEREVEEFLRWSPHVRRPETGGSAPRTTV
jgi:UDP-glucose 4-epimerase